METRSKYGRNIKENEKMDTERVLVVDDDLSIRESFRLILKPLYEVIMAENGKQAIECILKNNIELIILDLIMPGMTGYEVMEEIRRRAKRIDVLVVTGKGSLPNAKRVIELGAVGFISKPFSVAEVILNVSKIFEHQRYRKNLGDLIHKVKNLTLEEVSPHLSMKEPEI
jgi:DNA-binding NtrC family response regulator